MLVLWHSLQMRELCYLVPLGPLVGHRHTPCGTQLVAIDLRTQGGTCGTPANTLQDTSWIRRKFEDVLKHIEHLSKAIVIIHEIRPCPCSWESTTALFDKAYPLFLGVVAELAQRRTQRTTLGFCTLQVGP